MACLENPSSSTASSEHMSPRISFSNDFAESHYYAHSHNNNQVMVMRSQKQSPAPTPNTSDFEFSVSAGNNNNLSNMMTTADELFHKGHLLPFKPCSKTTTTLRDELLLQEEDDDQVMSLSFRPPKSSTNWKAFLGIKAKTQNHHQSSAGNVE